MFSYRSNKLDLEVYWFHLFQSLSIKKINLGASFYCSVGIGQVSVGFLYTNTEIFTLLRFNKLSRNASSPLLSSYIVTLCFDEGC